MNPKTGGVFDQVPFALTPGRPVNNEAAGRDRQAAADGRAGLPALPRERSASTSCCGVRPGAEAAGRSRGPASTVDDITAALLDLDSSYLAVHGPPGTGKTFTAGQ